MSELPSGLFRSWVHSYEEDTEGVAVYRPADFPFPPARGRRGLELAADGTFTGHPIGRGDAPDAVTGHWQAADDGRRLAVTFPDPDRPDRRVEVLHVYDRVLKIRA
ncbi:hypothetical protein [Streptomyces sp. H27-D2]|uniref:hypothetical protein n=1 Tax=Streptomyces sp. H27-D2 TaxID=3046304 RepID=UPI002DB672B1|nr:hypothetical protein [Streptomyces sp. H27-D2]MEC4019216.1 hypothetical protein [Streptomyces sp. H27-D2]